MISVASQAVLTKMSIDLHLVAMHSRHVTSGNSTTHLCAGILLWSIALIQEGRDVAAAFLFALLLNMKHLFAALAPLYLVYLLRHYCRFACHPEPHLFLGMQSLHCVNDKS